jgi:spore coat protein U-like protein
MRRTIVACATAAAMLPMPAVAAQMGTFFQAHINIQTSCQVTATSVDFGNVGVISGGEQATGTVTVLCSSGTPYTMSLSPTAGVTALNGQMVNGGNQIGYALSLSSAGGSGPGSATLTAVLFTQPTPPGGTYIDNRTVYLDY